MDKDQLKSLLSRFHIRPNKLLGQNFLLSEEVLDKIVEAGELESKDVVLEIGPGLGILTMRLAEEAAQVLAVEKDEKIYQALRKILKRYKNVKLIHKDALFFDIKKLIVPELVEGQPFDSPPAAGHSGNNTSYKVVANIPYYLTGKIIQNFLTAQSKPKLMVLLLQKEVAERLTARPGEMSLLSVSAQFYSDPEIISIVGKGNFYPEPLVDSAIVRLKVLPKPRFGVDEKKFFQFVRIGFAGRRKQLHNNLTSGLGAGDYKKILENSGLNPLARAQDLSMADWFKLYSALFSDIPARFANS